MSFGNSNIDLNTTLASVDSRSGPKTLYLPSTTTIYGKYIVVKDIGGSASSNPITLNTIGGDVFENNRNFLHISTNFGFTSLVANNGKWTFLTTPYENLGDRYLISTLNITNAGFGVSSLSSIVSYGLSTISRQPAPGVSSLSSIVGYGLSTIARQPTPGVSSLSSIVAYGLSSVAAGAVNPGVSSLSSIVAYGLVSINSEVFSLSSIISFGLSSVAASPGVSSLSSIVAYGLSSLGGQTSPGISSLSSSVSYGLSSLRMASGISSLSSIVSYGLSSFIIPLSTFSTAISTRFTTSSLEANVISSSYGIFSTLSTGSILVGYNTSPLQVDVGVTTVDLIASNITVNYGYVTANLGVGKEAPYWYALDVSGTSRLPIISSVTVTANSFIGDGSEVTNVQNAGVSSLSSIISYGLSTVTRQPGPGVSSLSSIIGYGLSTIAQQPAPGISSISSIIAYGLSSVAAGAGVSSLSSIISFGLSSVAAGATNPGVSSISSIIGYGLSSVAAGAGVSSLSSIISFGLSSVAAGATNPGVSSISSIISYGLSSVAAGSGVSSLSSIIGYGLSTVARQPAPGVSSISSIIAYGLSSVAAGAINPGVSTLSSIVAYGLSSFIIPLSTFSTAISTRFTTSTLTATNVITSNLTVNTDAVINTKLYLRENTTLSYEPTLIFVNSNASQVGSIILDNTRGLLISNVNNIEMLGTSISSGTRARITMADSYDPSVGTIEYGFNNFSFNKSMGTSETIYGNRGDFANIYIDNIYSLNYDTVNVILPLSILQNEYFNAKLNFYNSNYTKSAFIELDDSTNEFTITSDNISIGAQSNISIVAASGNLLTQIIGEIQLGSVGNATFGSTEGSVSIAAGGGSVNILTTGSNIIQINATGGGGILMRSSNTGIGIDGTSSLLNIEAENININGQVIINSNSSNPALTVNGKMNLIDTLYGTSNNIYVNSNLLYFNNNILYGSGQLQPQFITFT